MSPRSCAKCGATIPPGRTSCPRCLLEVAVARETPGADDSEPARRRRAPPPAPEELASSFPQLEIRALVGEGGMGAVYRARHKELDRDVALKILACDASDEPRLAERFLREARALAMLDHPGIVRVYDFGRAGERLYLLMEFVEGTNLRRLIDEKRLSPREALAIVPRICDALQYAHDEGVVHRDIKPENVLVDLHGKVKLADFGLAKLVGAAPDAHRTESGAVMGTYHYMAPEQLTKPRDVDHRADIYSLGVVFYEMLTGELPLGRFEPPSKRVKVEVALDEIVLKTLEREPERRYQHAVEVRTDVEGLGSGAKSPRPAESRRSLRQFLQALQLLGMVLIWHGYWVKNFQHGWGILATWGVGLGLLAWNALRLDAPETPERRDPWRIASTVGLYALGCVAWVLHRVCLWERAADDYVQPVTRSGNPFRWGGQEIERLATAFQPGVRPSADLLFLDASARPAWFSTTWFAVAALLLWGISIVPVSSKSARSRARIVWDQVVFAGLSAGIALLALVDLDSSRPPRSPVDAEGSSSSGIDATGARIQDELLARGYDVEARAEWRILERGTNAPLGRALALDAQPSSVFGRWSIEPFDGPIRVAPHIVVRIVQLDGPTHVRWDLGQVAGDGRQRFREELEWIGELGRELAAE